MVVDCSLFREHPRLTAARECYEETLGILGTSEELAASLSDFKTNNCFKVISVLLLHMQTGFLSATVQCHRYIHKVELLLCTFNPYRS